MSFPRSPCLRIRTAAVVIAVMVVPYLTGWKAATVRAQAPPPAARSHKGVFYDNDFSYLLDPALDRFYLGDRLKRLELGRWITYDVGGQFRLRHHSERNHRGLGLTGQDDDFLLYRTRVYVNAEIGPALRAYVEMLDAVSNYEAFPPRPIEENRSDLQNLFGDVRILSTARGELWARLGRQELFYGSQRVLSPLDWGNTRRTFEGYKLFWRSDEWDVDAFWVRPVLPDPHQFDSPDYDQEFMGLYSSCRRLKNKTLDLYYLRLENEAADIEFDTLGTRLDAARGPWLAEIEAAVQLGSFQGASHIAGAWTLGLGRKLEDLPWKPVIWAYYDWASGAPMIGNGYHHLFPLSHGFLGYMDLFGRRNIETPNVKLVLSPCEKLKLMAWYFAFFLEDPRDVPYTVLMSPFNTNNPPADPFLGQELDLVATWQFDPRAQILFGYSHFFAGDYYQRTAGLAHRGDADFFYTHFQLDF